MKTLHYFGLIQEREIADLAEAAYQELKRCRLCPWECRVNRLKGEMGVCGANAWGEVFYAGLLLNEERDLNPAYEVFFTGCNLSCRFCYLMDKVRGADCRSLINHPLYRDAGLRAAKSLCAVGGEPAVNLLASLYLYGTVPVRSRVWNSNMVYSGLVAEVVAQVVDVVVADIHFGNDACAERISGFLGYMSTVQRNIELARQADKEVIVRHLLLPGHLECCALPAVRLMARHFPDLRFNVLAPYLPPSSKQAGECRELCGQVSDAEVNRVLEEATRLGLKLEPHTTPEKLSPEKLALMKSGACAERSELIIDAQGRVIVPHLTPGLLDAVRHLQQ